MTPDPSAWLPTNAFVDDALRVLCFPHAGGGSAMFHRWSRRLPDWLHIVPIKLPGREDRGRETAIDNMATMIDELSFHLADYVADGTVALFGHSMGGLIAYEWAQRLRDTGIAVKHVFVSSCRPPSNFGPSDEPLHTLTDREMLEKLTSKYGAGPTSPDEFELMMLMAPTIRADLQLLETYRHPDHQALNCPLSLLGGAEDPQVTCVVLQQWQPFTTGAFKVRVFPGHHFYLRTQDDAIIRYMTTQLGG